MQCQQEAPEYASFDSFEKSVAIQVHDLISL